MGIPTIEQAVRFRLGLYLKELYGQAPQGVYDMVVKAVERPVIEMMVEHAGGNQALAAEYLGINRITLRKKLAA
ncbi:Fis family transcriptional regulator [Paraburkholderia sp. MM5496-R1]|uniref:helix-turn-helix domain-containing protein n=1 Tax=Paraburkholderia sp. MM5496-R1 TaxID=2991065 RepID=UPI003D1B1AE1